LILLILSVLLLVPASAAADRVTVKGTVLEGTVKSISSKEIVMSTVYGKGELHIPTGDVTAIETDAPFHVLEAEQSHLGRIVGITPLSVSLAQPEGPVAEIPLDQVQAAPRSVPEDAAWFARQRVERPWWGANVDVAFASSATTTHTTALSTGVGVRRERGPDRTRFDASYLRSTTRDDEDDPDTPDVNESHEDVTGDELRGKLRHEHDLTARLFAFGSIEAEHDGTEALSLRTIPTLGAGYKLVKTESLLFGVDAGLAYVYQRYFGGDSESYPSLAFGAESSWQMRCSAMGSP
jgi:putative salt-induced outer membrane protein YdiY